MELRFKKQYIAFILFITTAFTATALAAPIITSTQDVPDVTTTSTTTTTLPEIVERSNNWEVNTIPTTTTAPPTPEEIVNSIVYIHDNPEPAMKAFTIVATARGWSQEEINTWYDFAKDVMLHESGYCYNLRRGAIIGKAEGCVMAKQGKHEDSGFAQLISIHYDPGKWLCEQEHLCSSEDIIATPWNSMVAFIALLERNGKQPWCFTDSLRATSRCQNAPKNPPSV